MPKSSSAVWAVTMVVAGGCGQADSGSVDDEQGGRDGASQPAPADGGPAARVPPPGEPALPARATTHRAAPAWVETQRLVASDNVFDDEFATAVAVSAETMVIGAFRDDDQGMDSGSAYVFRRSAGAWDETAKLLPGDGDAADAFGRAVAVDGDTIVVTAPDDEAGGAAYVFVTDGDTWSQQARLTAADGQAGWTFGRSVAISGDTVVVGAPRDPHAGFLSGSAYVFVRAGAAWSQEAKLVAPDASPQAELGYDVAIDGGVIVVGAPEKDDTSGDEPGSAYVFVLGVDGWALDTELVPATTAPRDHFGISVAIDGTTILVGAPWNDDLPVPGYAHVFIDGQDGWTEDVRLAPGDAGFRKRFGWEVDLDGDHAWIGAITDAAAGDEAGAAYVFGREEGVWAQERKVIASDAMPSDLFGSTLSVSGDTAVVGLLFEDNDAERAFVFQRLTVGDACADPTTCASGFCVDGVCCDEACGEAAPDDCLVCSASLGAAVDGRCAPVSTAFCDDGAFCNGVEACAMGMCVSPGDPCEGSDGDDDCSETCDEAADTCDAFDPDGSSCSDWDLCTPLDTCQRGVCVPDEPLACAPSGTPCREVPSCDPARGECVEGPMADGAPCDDGAPCTTGDACVNGACIPGAPLDCGPSSTPCLRRECSLDTGACDELPAPDGTPCEGGTCTAGTCGEGGNGEGGAANATSASSGPGAGPASATSTTTTGGGSGSDEAIDDPKTQTAPSASGCACRAAPSAASALEPLLALAGLLTLRRRRPPVVGARGGAPASAAMAPARPGNR
jgi:MYXO-CTERM domain-containing protein